MTRTEQPVFVVWGPWAPFGLILNSVPFGYEVPSFMKSPSRTYDVSVVCSCRCLGISLPGSILSMAAAGPKDLSLFKTLIVTVPLVFGNGAGMASVFEVSTICIRLIELSFFSVLLCAIYCFGLLNLLNVGYYKSLLLKFEGFPCP